MDSVISNIYNQIPRIVRFAFCVTFVCGIFVHMYFMTEMITNHDSVLLLEHSKEMYISSGRWFAYPVLALNGITQMPWVIGLSSTLYLSLSCALIVDLFRLTSKLCVTLLAIALQTFPATGSALVYFMDSFAFCILLSSFAVWISRKYKFGFLIGALSVAAIIGIYQASFFIASALFVGVLLMDEIDMKGAVLAEQLTKGIKYLVALLAGWVLYAVILKIIQTVTSIQLSSYASRIDIDTLFGNIPDLLHAIYINFLKHIMFPEAYRTLKTVMPVICVLIIICTFVMLAVLLSENKSKKSLLLILALLAMFPAASNGIYILANQWGYISALMIYSHVIILVIALTLTDRMSLRTKESMKRLGIVCGIQVVCLFMLCYNNFLQVNEAYVKSDIAISQAKSYSLKLSMRLEELPEYVQGMPVVRLGYLSSEPDSPKHILDNSMTGFTSRNDIINAYSYLSFVMMYLGEDVIFTNISAEELESNQSLIDEMSVYPAEGSLKVVDDRVYLKLGDI